MHVGLDSSHPCCPCTRKQMTSASHWHHSLAQHSAVIKNVLWFVNWIRSTSAFLVLWEDGAAPGKSHAFHRSQDAPWNLMATERHWAGTHLALLPCQPQDWMRKPGPQKSRQRYHLETTEVKTTRKLLQGEMETSKPRISVSHRQPHKHAGKPEHPSAHPSQQDREHSKAQDRISRTTHGLCQVVQSMSNPIQPADFFTESKFST